jgi:hypothetical protein
LLRTGASAEIASAANATAIGFDIDLDDGGIFLPASRGERLATTRATGLCWRQDAFFSADGQVRIIPASRKWVAWLLASVSFLGGRGGRGGRRRSIRGNRIFGERIGRGVSVFVVGSVA